MANVADLEAGMRFTVLARDVSYLTGTRRRLDGDEEPCSTLSSDWAIWSPVLLTCAQSAAIFFAALEAVGSARR